MTDPQRRPATPTVQQGQRTTPTVHQGQTTTPTVQQGERPPSGPGTTPTFPDQLRDRFDPVECSGHGTEGAVWRCLRVGDRSEVAVKVHWVGRPMDTKLLTHLRDKAFRRHVPEILDHGTFITSHGEVAWVAMEYLDTSLAEVIAAGPLPPARAMEVLTELAAALEFWQTTVDRNPLDFKPDNLMFRRGNAGQVVIADFGGVSAFTASQQQGGPVLAAIAYTPPEETWQEKRSPWPWWSLGEIAYQLVTGHTRFQLPNGDMPSDQVVIRKRELNELGLAHVSDPRWQLLIRGLLTRDPHDRWTSKEVRSWLAGGSPRVAATQLGEQQPTHSPITFGDGRTFTDPAALAAAMAENWRAAADWLASTGRQTLLDWLRKENLAKRFDTTLLHRSGDDGAHLHRAILAFGAAFAPEGTPRMCGHTVDPAGVTAMVGGHDGFATARRLVTAEVLGLAAGYRCTHLECAGRCAILDRAAGELNSVVTDATHLVATVAEGSEPVSDSEKDAVHGLALSLLLAPSTAATHLRKGVRPLLGMPRWWRAVRAAALAADPATHQGAVALVAADVLCRRAIAERAETATDAVAVLQPRRVARTVAGGVLCFVALVLVAWVVGRFGVAALVFQADPVSSALALAQEPLYYQQFAPALFLLAIVVVALGRGSPAWVLGAAVLAAMLAAVAPRLPAFTMFELPDLFGSLTDAWRGQEALGAGIIGFAALMCGIGAVRLLGPARQRPGPLLGTAPVAARRLLVTVLAGLMLPAVLWACGVIRLAVSESSPPATSWIGRQLAAEQSGYLLVLLLVAVLVGLGWPRTKPVLALGFLAAAGVGLWAGPIPALAQVHDPTAFGLLAGIADLWGAGAFWAGLLVYLPLTIAGVRLAGRLGRG